MNIKETANQIYANNKAKGFWDEERHVGEMLMLVVTELAEALEAHRKEGIVLPNENEKHNMNLFSEEDFFGVFKLTTKDTFPDEIADAVIRLFDISVGLGIDLEYHISAKMKYNSLRPYRHGKKY